MSTGQERTVSVTTYYTEPAYPNILNFPAHTSLDDAHAAILTAINQTRNGESQIPDLIIAFGEFS